QQMGAAIGNDLGGIDLIVGKVAFLVFRQRAGSMSLSASVWSFSPDGSRTSWMSLRCSSPCL
ncbi:MAG TPA: hypothetical protein VK558_15215, partial [Patescibacteria group bacterium]|nr:hypothetical protein [Patescibacteria group bacterium]